jgi:hypothetical protein
METQLHSTDENHNPSALESQPEIYSKRAIWGFAVFFATIFGGVLLMQNLKAVGKRKEANQVLLFSILFTVASVVIVNTIPARIPALNYILNFTGAGILIEFYFKKYFPATYEYRLKKIWKPLVISFLIIIPFLLAAIYAIDIE